MDAWELHGGCLAESQDRQCSTAHPPDVTHKRPMPVVIEVDAGLGWEQEGAIVLARIRVWRKQGALVSENDLARTENTRVSGRGPTIDMSPLRTFQNCGSSSSFVALRARPTTVILESPSRVRGKPSVLQAL
jgi:hypothetical protein